MKKYIKNTEKKKLNGYPEKPSKKAKYIKYTVNKFKKAQTISFSLNYQKIKKPK